MKTVGCAAAGDLVVTDQDRHGRTTICCTGQSILLIIIYPIPLKIEFGSAGSGGMTIQTVPPGIVDLILGNISSHSCTATGAVQIDPQAVMVIDLIIVNGKAPDSSCGNRSSQTSAFGVTNDGIGDLDGILTACRLVIDSQLRILNYTI